MPAGRSYQPLAGWFNVGVNSITHTTVSRHSVGRSFHRPAREPTLPILRFSAPPDRTGASLTRMGRSLPSHRVSTFSGSSEGLLALTMDQRGINSDLAMGFAINRRGCPCGRG